MANDKSEVKLGADVGGLKAGMNAGADATVSALQRIREMLLGTAATSKATAATMTQGAAQSGAAFQQMGTATASGVTKANAAITAFAGKMGAFLGVLAGGAAITGGIRNLIDEADEIRELQNVFGMSADEASRFSVALKLVGKSAGEFTDLGLKLGKALKTDEERMRQLGVVTRDASGHLLPLDSIMKNAFRTMQEYKSGIDQTGFAMEVFGKGAKEVYDYMRLTPEILARAAEMQKSLGIEMGPERQAQIRAYQIEVEAVKIVFEELSQQVGEAVMPTLQRLVAFFSQHGPAAMKVLGYALSLITSTFEALGAVVATVAIVATAGLNQIGETARGLARILDAVLTGRLLSIPQIMTDTYNRVKAIGQDAAGSVKDAWSRAYSNIKTQWSDPPAAAGAGSTAAGPGGGGSRRWTPKAGPAKEVDRVSEWDAALKAQKDAYERMKLDQGSFERWSDAQTAAYWERIKNTHKLSTKELQAVDGKWYDAQRAIRTQAFESLIASLEAEKAAIKFNYDERIRIAQEQARLIAQAYGSASREAIAAEARVTAEIERQADQRARIREIGIKQEETRAMHGANMEAMEIQRKAALREIDAQEAFRQEALLQEKIYQVKRAAIEKQRALEVDPAQIAARNAELEQLEIEHQERMTEIHNRAEMERKAAAIQTAQAVEASMSQAFQDIMSGTKSAKDALLDFAKSVTAAFNKLAADNIAKAIFGAGTTGGGGVSWFASLFGSIFGGGGGTGFLPPGAAGPPMFAAGTPYVPRDMLAFVHKGERITPASQNNGNSQSNVVFQNTWNIAGPMDTRTRDQIYADQARMVYRARQRNL